VADIDRASQLAQEGDEVARRAFEEAGALLGLALGAYQARHRIQTCSSG
jgi:hypothetical protein